MSTCLNQMTVTDHTLQRAAAITLNISWTSFLFQFSPTFFILFWHVQRSSSEKKLSFLSISSKKVAGTGRYRQKRERRGEIKWSEREKSFQQFGERTDWWEMSSKGVAAAAVSDLRDKLRFLFCTSSYVVASLSLLWKVFPLKRRHWTPEETNAKREAIFWWKTENGL